jgi:CelD/BcsL family acetyltransferase involved in cellulose biosynthesis
MSAASEEIAVIVRITRFTKHYWSTDAPVRQKACVNGSTSDAASSVHDPRAMAVSRPIAQTNAMTTLSKPSDSLVLQWTVHHLSSANSFVEHCATWDELCKSLFPAAPLLDSRFVTCLLRQFGSGAEYLCIGRADGEVRGMCILRRKDNLAGIWASFLPAQAQVGPTLLTAEIDISSLTKSLPKPAREIDLLCNDPKVGGLHRLSGMLVDKKLHALTMNVALDGSFEEYWAQRPHKLIQNLRRYAKRLAEQGTPVRLVRIDGVQELGEAVTRFGQLESSGWKGREGTAVTPDGKQGHFYRDVLQAFGQTGQACAYELWLGDDLLASRLLLEQGGSIVMLKTAFNEKFEKFAPGRLLLKAVLEDLFERKQGGLIEFYTDANSDLLAWSSGTRWIKHISIYRNRPAAWLLKLARKSSLILTGMDKKLGPDRRHAVLTGADSQVDVYPHPQSMPADAIGLLNKAESKYVELGADWFSNLIASVYKNPGEVAVYVLRRHGRPVAILPTVKKNDTGTQELSSLSNYYTAIYSPVFADGLIAEELVPLLRVLKEQNQQTPTYRFYPMDPHSTEFRLLKEGLCLAGLQPFPYFVFGNWFFDVDSGWTEYLSRRSGQIRSTVKRMGKRFAAEGGHLELIHGGERLEKGLAAFESVYRMSWKTAEPYPNFVADFMRLCARRGWLRLSVAWLNEQAVAVQFWYVANQRAYVYKLAYDERFKHFAPGTLLTALMMEQVLDRDKVVEVDYLIGDDPYKKDWMSDRRERWGLIAYNLRTPRGFLGCGTQLLGQFVRALCQRYLPLKQHLIQFAGRLRQITPATPATVIPTATATSRTPASIAPSMPEA